MDTDNDYSGMDATYSPEDNKLRLYAAYRLDDDTYSRVKAAGFRWAPKQELFVAPSWSPSREDLLLELCGEIDDEDYSTLDRSADRADRFSGYRDKRRTEAHDHADTFDAGPGVHGHQNRPRAERSAKRHDRQRLCAVSQWSKAEYWQHRTAGVIGHALYKARPDVRRRRILKLEALQRKHEKSRKEAADCYEAWTKIITMEGADQLLPLSDGYAVPGEMNAAQRFAYAVANTRSFCRFYHPTSEAANEEAKRIWNHGFSAYDFLTDDEFIHVPFERFTPKQFAELYTEKVTPPDATNTYSYRWSRHYELRLAYENAMLGNEGGKVAETEIEPGGWINADGWTGTVFSAAPGGWMQIHGVNRSPKTKRVTSVKVMGTVGYRDPKPGIVSVNIERLGEDAYRAPTDAEREAFKAEQKAKAKSKPKSPPLINPTPEDAERLQRLWNDRSKVVPRASGAEVCLSTQAKYSHLSRGDAVSTVGVDANGKRASYTNKPVAFRIRTAWRMSRANSVILLTDKPQKPLPLDWAAIEADAQPEPVETH